MLNKPQERKNKLFVIKLYLTDFFHFRPGLTSSFGISNENRPAYRNTSHPQRAFVQLNCMREEGILTDVALVASGHEVNIIF